MARARLAEALNYVSTEAHKTYSPFFYGLEGEAKAKQSALLDARLQVVEDRLEPATGWRASSISSADAYFFTVMNWSKGVGHDLSPFPRVQALRDKVAARPAVQKAMQAEGLI